MALTQERAHAGLVDQLDEQVRAMVRSEGVDPQRDAVLVRRMAERVVREHDERSLTGRVAPIADVEAMVGELVARISGFGALQPYLEDPEVEEIWINCPRSAKQQVRRGVSRASPRSVRSSVNRSGEQLS